MRMKPTKDTLLLPIMLLSIFYAIALWRYLATGKAFYLWNFGYLGTALAVGIFLSGALPKERFTFARGVTQLMVGSYLLFFVGIFGSENMQIEGFWLYLYSGIFAGATLHYLIAKIGGPFIFNRGWCGWACWTAMVLDLFPWRRPQKPVNKRWMLFRYVHFIAVAMGMTFLFFMAGGTAAEYHSGSRELYWLLAGNLAYYIAGFTLAAMLKDNRAFCKYICPIPVFQKVGAKYSLLKMEVNTAACIDCRLCEKNCPMQIELLAYKNRGLRIQATECILCQTCANVCPENAISATFKMDK